MQRTGGLTHWAVGLADICCIHHHTYSGMLCHSLYQIIHSAKQCETCTVSKCEMSSLNRASHLHGVLIIWNQHIEICIPRICCRALRCSDMTFFACLQLGFTLLALIWEFDFPPFMVLIIAILNDGTPLYHQVSSCRCLHYTSHLYRSSCSAEKTCHFSELIIVKAYVQEASWASMWPTTQKLP